MSDLSILIPSRNEEFLSRTIDDILKNIRGNTEIIVGLDGRWAEPRIADNPKVTLLHYSESIGQRAVTNQCARLSTAKYLMKVDAHCAFDEGFDIKMMESMQDDWTMVPVMRNLHVFDWVCPDGHRRYQSPSGPCRECGKPTVKDIVWIAKTNPQSTAYSFDKELHFQYFNEFKKRPEGRGELTESMSLQGSCFMLTREKYWELDICDEAHGSWGQQGTEVACKTWLSGEKAMVNHKTWYAHMFRAQGGDFGFPYPISGGDVERARKHSRELFLQGKWNKAKYDINWLVKRFSPVPDWDETPPKPTIPTPNHNPSEAPPSISKGNNANPAEKEKPTKGILYYTDNQINMRLSLTCRKYIKDSGFPITSVTLKPTNFGKNIAVEKKRSYETMFEQILTGLKAMNEDIVYFCEHDILYHPDHFKFTPPKVYKFYYNGNYWFIRLKDGFAIHYNVSPLSGLVAYRKPLIKHFEERMNMIKKVGFSFKMGFEPMTHKRIKWKNWYNSETFMTDNPNLDLCHGENATWKRWSQDKFRKKPKFWKESNIKKIPGWPDLPEIVSRFNF